MKYTPEQIRPKKYPDEKPSKSGFDVQYRVLLDDVRQALFDWNPVAPFETMMTWDRYVTWFIDIPNPPDELKFLAYPQNKPSEDGMYWAHLKDSDDWSAWWLDAKNECGWDEWVDWYIPIRLDKENEMEKGREMICSIHKPGRYFEVVEIVDEAVISLKVGQFTPSEGTSCQIYITPEELGKVIIEIGDKIGYDVVKCEPELLPCPNPICEQTKYLEVIEIPSRYAYPNKEFIVECKNCGYRGGRGSSEEQAVKLHNLIADNAKRSSLCEPENEYYGLWCDEDGNVLPRRENGTTQHEYNLRKGSPYDLNDVAKLTRKEK